MRTCCSRSTASGQVAVNDDYAGKQTEYNRATVTRETRLTPDGTEWGVWEALEAEAARLYQGEWYAIARGVLYHGLDWSVANQLDGRGIDGRHVLITTVMPPPPHRF